MHFLASSWPFSEEALLVFADIFANFKISTLIAVKNSFPLNGKCFGRRIKKCEEESRINKAINFIDELSIFFTSLCLLYLVLRLMGENPAIVRIFARL
jgi:hypothetical protein